jgi:hypothetical protein
MDRAIDEAGTTGRDLSALRSRLPWLVSPITIAHTVTLHCGVSIQLMSQAGCGDVGSISGLRERTWLGDLCVNAFKFLMVLQQS